jgi:hypothetical protein
MIEPRRALVRPRVISPITGEALLLEDAALDAARRSPGGVPIQITGGFGADKTTALHHLQAVFGAAAPATLGVWRAAELVEGNFEGISARGVDFSEAKLRGSLWTGSDSPISIGKAIAVT